MKWPKLFPDRGASKALTVARSAARVETKALPVISYPAELFWLAGNPTQDPFTPGIGQRRAFAAVALVYACMTYRATKLSEGPLWIVDETNDGEKWLEGEHQLSPLLERPNPDMSMADLLELLSLYDDATGAWLLVLNRDRAGRVGSMYPYARDEFSVEPANGQLYGKFGVQTLQGYRTFGPDEVIYFKRPSLASLYSATSKVDAALAHVNVGDQMRQAITSMLRRAIRPGAKVEIPQNYFGDQADRLRAEYDAKFAGYANAGKLLIVEGGGKLEMLEAGLKDLELGPVQRDVEAAICQCFQLHPAAVAARLGVENSSGFADLVDSATKLAYDVAFIPTWTRMAEKLTMRLLRPVDDSPRRFLRFDLTKVRALQKDMTAAVEQASKASPFWTVNEQRAHTGKKAIEDGDEIRIPVAPAPNGEDDETDADGKPKTKAAFGNRSMRVVTSAALATLSLSAAWQDFDQKASRQESRYEQAATAQLERERDAVVNIIEDSVPAQKAEESDAERFRRVAAAALLAPYLEVALLRIAAEFGPHGVFNVEWQRRFTRLVRNTALAAARETAAAIGIDFAAANPRFQALVRQRVDRLTGNVTETTLARVREVITQARDEGVGIGEITKRIRDDAFGGEITTSRAKTIARTETVGALNEGEHLAAIESGVMQSKRWLSQRDGRVRDSHRTAEGEGWIPIGQPYSNGLDHPHQQGAPAEEVINCRCGQLFSDLTADEANRGTT